MVQYRYNPAFSHRSVSSSYVSVYLKSLSPQICCGKKFGETPTKYNTLLTARNEIRKLKTLMTTGIRVTGIYYTSGSSKDVWNVKTATSGSILVQFQLGKWWRARPPTLKFVWVVRSTPAWAKLLNSCWKACMA